jgi:hypothetical protein
LRLITNSNFSSTERQVAGLLALENPADVDTGVAVGVARGRREVAKPRHEFGTRLMAAR